MNFGDRGFLTDHIRTTMGFYHPRCIDTQHGGFFHHFRDDGSVYDAATRHLVSSTRFVFNYAMASIHFPDPEYRRAIEHGLAFLQEAHWQPEAWAMRRRCAMRRKHANRKHRHTPNRYRCTDRYPARLPTGTGMVRDACRIARSA